MLGGNLGNGETAAAQAVLYAVESGIATITLNRPERRNALSVAAAERLYLIWGEIDADDSVRAVVLSAADCGTFCAGMDLKEAAEIQRERNCDILDVLTDPFYERMRSVKKPIIAAMTGHFAAGGMVLALNSDLRVGLAGTKGGITEAKLGRGSPWAVPMLWMLPQAILLEMTLTGEMVDIERLHALGFVNYVEPTPDAVRRRAYQLAARIRDNAPLTVQAGKASLLAALSLGCEGGFARAKEIYKSVYASEDAQEGPRAFAEKRPARWLGR
jgi:enoyl-CoA hydratase/carnithine racemase